MARVTCATVNDSGLISETFGTVGGVNSVSKVIICLNMQNCRYSESGWSNMNVVVGVSLQGRNSFTNLENYGDMTGKKPKHIWKYFGVQIAISNEWKTIKFLNM